MNLELSRSEKIEFLSEPADYSMADEWFDMASPEHFWFKWRFDALKKVIPKDYSWGRVLDVGCGNGIVIQQIEGYYGCKISGCDLNLKALSMVTKGPNPLYFYNIHQQHKDFKEAFQTLIIMDVLEHIEAPIAFLDSINFHLKPGGSLIINVPAIKSFYSKYDEVAGHFRRYSISSLKKELSSAGFELERYSYWGMSMIPLLLIRKFILKSCPNDLVIKTGFDPKNGLINFILESMRRIECGIFKKVPIGTSLVAIARKKK